MPFSSKRLLKLLYSFILFLPFLQERLFYAKAFGAIGFDSFNELLFRLVLSSLQRRRGIAVPFQHSSGALRATLHHPAASQL